MKRFLAFFLLAFLGAASAQEIVLDQYQCIITLPAGEGWQRGVSMRIPAGEMVFNASRPDTRQVFAVVVLPNMPTDDIEAPGITNRVLETLSAIGYKTGPPKFIQWKGAKYAQFVGRRQDPQAADFISMTRATLRNKVLYLMLIDGRGDESRLADPHFMRVMESFRFEEPAAGIRVAAADPLFKAYRLGAYGCVVAAAVLAFLYGGVMLATRRQSYR
jgi:hypothetical protein